MRQALIGVVGTLLSLLIVGLLWWLWGVIFGPWFDFIGFRLEQVGIERGSLSFLIGFTALGAAAIVAAGIVGIIAVPILKITKRG